MCRQTLLFIVIANCAISRWKIMNIGPLLPVNVKTKVVYLFRHSHMFSANWYSSCCPNNSLKSPRGTENTLSWWKSSRCLRFSSSVNSRHMRPMVAPSWHTDRCGFLAFTWNHTYTEQQASHHYASITNITQFSINFSLLKLDILKVRIRVWCHADGMVGLLQMYDLSALCLDNAP